MSEPTHRLLVCTSCRPKGHSRGPRPGAELFERLVSEHSRWARRANVQIEAVECLSLCSRPCGVALSGPGKWTYLFGDLQPGRDEAALIDCVTGYTRSTDGFLPRNDRPRVMQGGILGRVPPPDRD